MDPNVDVLFNHGWKGAALYIGWKLATKALATWKDLSAQKLTNEAARDAAFSGSLDTLSKAVQTNTVANVEQSGVIRQLISRLDAFLHNAEKGKAA